MLRHFAPDLTALLRRRVKAGARVGQSDSAAFDLTSGRAFRHPPYARFAAGRRPVSCHRPVLEVGDAGRLDGPDLLELHLRVPEVVEEASTVAEQHRDDVELKFVEQSRCQVLLSDVGAAPKHDVFAAGRLPCLFERGLDSVGDEVKSGPSFHLYGIARVMGEDEHGVVVGRVVAPPASPLLVAPGTTVDRAEHVPAHHGGPDVLARFLDYPCALIHLAALLALGLAPGGQRNYPFVEPLAALAERVLLALVRAGDEPVQRDRYVTPKLAHRASLVGGHWGRGLSMPMTGPRRETNRGCATGAIGAVIRRREIAPKVPITGSISLTDSRQRFPCARAQAPEDS